MRVRLIKILDATAGFFLCWMGGLLLHLFGRNPAGGLPVSPVFKRILVIRPGGMGDMILLQPLLKSLRKHYPDAILDVVCEKRNRDIPALAGDDAGLLLYDSKPIRTLVQLLRTPYDLAIDTEQFHHFSAVIALLSRAPVRIGFKINPGRNTLYTHLVNYDLEGYEAGEFMRLLAPLGINDEAVVKGCLKLSGQTAGRTGAVVIHVGGSTRYKHWETGKYVDLVKRLGDMDGGATMILVGGAGDARLAEEIARRAGLGDQVKVRAGSLAIPQTADLIGKASLFIGGDSGLAHLAVALGTPTVVLFGPSDHKKWGASGEGNVVVRNALPCSPCFIFGYHKFCHSIACMSGITVDQVMTAVRSVSGGKVPDC